MRRYAASFSAGRRRGAPLNLNVRRLLRPWLRWIAVVPAAVAGWWLVVVVAITLHGLVFSFCAPEDVVSGACVAPWFSQFESALLYFAVALSATLVVLVPTIMAPAHRRLIAWVAYLVGAIVALSIGGLSMELAIAVASGFIAAVLASSVYARKVA